MEKIWKRISITLIIFGFSCIVFRTCNHQHKLKTEGINGKALLVGPYYYKFTIKTVRYNFLDEYKHYDGYVYMGSHLNQQIGDTIDVIFLPDDPEINVPVLDLNNPLALIFFGNETTVP